MHKQSVACLLPSIVGAIASLWVIAVSPASVKAQQDDWEWATAYSKAGDTYMTGNLTEALRHAEKALALAEKISGTQTREQAASLNLMGVILNRLGRPQDAAPFLTRAFELREASQYRDPAKLSETLNNLGVVSLHLGRTADAERYHKRALALRNEHLPNNRSDLAQSLNNLATVYLSSGNPEKAKPLLQRAVALLSKSTSKTPTSTLREAELPNFGEADARTREDAYLHVGKGGVAIRSRPSISTSGAPRVSSRSPMPGTPTPPAITTRPPAPGGQQSSNGSWPGSTPGPNSSSELENRNTIKRSHDAEFAVSLINLAMMQQSLYVGPVRDLAGGLYERAIEIQEQVLGPDHPDIAAALNNLAELRVIQSRYGEARQLHQRALAIREKALAPDHPLIAASLTNLARLLGKMDKAGDAIQLLERAVQIAGASLGETHPDVALMLRSQAIAMTSIGDLAGALKAHERATRVLQSPAASVGASYHTRGGSTGGGDNRGRIDYHFESHIAALYKAGRSGVLEPAVAREQSFLLAQRLSQNAAARALKQLAVRFSKGEGSLAEAVREWQDLRAKWTELDERLLGTLSLPTALVIDRDVRALREEIKITERRIDESQTRLRHEFPDFSELITPRPLSLSSAQKLLQPDEALIHFQIGAFGSYAWAVTSSEARWVRLPLKRHEISRLVDGLRCGLDGTAWAEAHGSRCQSLLKVDSNYADYASGGPLPFDLSLANKLYVGLFEQFEQMVSKKRLLVVPSGPLTRLPFAVLTTKVAAKALPDDIADYAKASWIIKKHALTTLPSVAGLRAMRTGLRPNPAPKQLLGIANPLLDGDQNHHSHADHFRKRAKLARDVTNCKEAQAAGNLGVRKPISRTISSFDASGIADLEHLKLQAPLPETAVEVCQVASLLGAKSATVLLGDRATETSVKSLSSASRPGDSLANYRIVHFATHGTLPGDIEGTAEPGLILSPPSVATERDDGFLSASEIARLKLNADWVILSACNTAGGGARKFQEPLSGLATAFTYAGARTLLVSHWAVDSHATVKLITETFSILRERPAIGRAKALQLSMLSLQSGNQHTPHPTYWAPFVIVGEGGS